jgi:hypothetical protein
MKRYRRRLILLALLLAVCVAGAVGLAWPMGFIPYTAGSEEEFMEQQLRRVLHGGILRNKAEREIAAMLPEDPTIDDLRIAYSRYVGAQTARNVRAFYAANPALADPCMPPVDARARNALDHATELANALLERFKQEEWYNDPARLPSGETREQFMRESAKLTELLAQAKPMPGHGLIGYEATRFYEWDTPRSGSAVFMAGLARVQCLFADDRSDEALEELHALADYSRGVLMSPCLLGWLYYIVANGVVYETGVLPMAARGLLPADALSRLADMRALPHVDAVEIAEREWRLSLQSLLHFNARIAATDDELSYRRHFADSAFKNHGATSLRHWVRQSVSPGDQALWQHQADIYDRLRTTHANFENREQAAAILQSMQDDRVAMNAGVPQLLASCALVRVEIDALLLAVRIHELKLSQPNDWQQAAARVLEAHPFLKLERRDDQLEVFHDESHPVVQEPKERALARVPAGEGR